MTSPTDPPVRSVRVAVALAERFRDLLSGPTTGDVNAMSLRIGEAQQLFPEIWRHLDDARNGFRATGKNVADYDNIRVYEAGMLGVTNMDLVTVGYGRSEHQIRTAEFNIAGYERARQAAGALMRCAPEIDWDGLQREEDAQLAAAGSVRSNSWIPLVVGIAIAIIVLYFVVKK